MTTSPTIDLAVLTSRQRLVVQLHFYDNWSEREIADGIGVSHQAIHGSLHAALARLAEASEWSSTTLGLAAKHHRVENVEA